MRLKHLTLTLATLYACAMSSVYPQDGYQSPYRMNFSVPTGELLAADQYAPRNDWRLESEAPYEEWYSRRMRKENGAWGPHPRHYPRLADHDRLSTSWKRQRVLAVGCKHIGLPYQHHHIPDWQPPSDWPWKPVAYGRNSKGLDCSDFTSWCYNYGLGIKFTSNVKKQAELTQVEGAGGEGALEVRTLTAGDYDSLVKTLKAGDLLYIRNNKGEIGHVIMWMGEHAQSADGTPLIIDCTGMGHKDANGADIPIGVHIRPFSRNSWYYNSFSHAHRILHD